VTVSFPADDNLCRIPASGLEVARGSRRLIAAVALTRASTGQTGRGGYAHYHTDILVKDPRLPCGLHARVVGFRPVAPDDQGKPHCRSGRIAMVLDLKAACEGLRERRD
jgi:hypothetical protein